MPQLIVSKWYTPEFSFKSKSVAGLNSKMKDNVSQGYKPTAANSSGILCTLTDVPLAA